ncbi:hypothetical protein T492DRAFT_914725 [Pavlovales sp. CCMP2436]|nr:hypothetical protein T492DRAFT_914725 [Pavlovales sp. CCMP2436]
MCWPRSSVRDATSSSGRRLQLPAVRTASSRPAERAGEEAGGEASAVQAAEAPLSPLSPLSPPFAWPSRSAAPSSSVLWDGSTPSSSSSLSLATSPAASVLGSPGPPSHSPHSSALASTLASPFTSPPLLPTSASPVLAPQWLPVSPLRLPSQLPPPAAQQHARRQPSLTELLAREVETSHPLPRMEYSDDSPELALDVHQTYLAQRYCRLLATGGERSSRVDTVTASVPIQCARCATILSYTDQLLCVRRRWGMAGGPSEPACYVNSLVSSSVSVKPCYEEQLAQGLFDMADVHCRGCGRQVGYAFVADKTRRCRNENQVGRFGLVTSCFTIGSGEVPVLAARELPAEPLDAALAAHSSARTERAGRESE